MTRFGKMGLMAGVLALGSLGQASFLDAKIAIERALGSPTLTVKYSGAAAVLVELRINGQSLATRGVTSGKDAGETNFKLNLADLKDGDNEVEVRLFDKTGTLLGTNKSTIKAERKPEGPVSLSSPKNGGTVQGRVEMKVGFGTELKNVFVSYFVDSDFKSMTNFPPYTFAWDSTTASNGWHDIEAWVVDESTTTYKSRKVRVFVNNPGGRTDRVGLGGGDLSQGAGAGTVGDAKGTKPVGAPSQADLRPVGGPIAPTTSTPVKTVTTKTIKTTSTKKTTVKKAVDLTPSTNRKTGRDVAPANGLKQVPVAPPIALGPQSMTPTGTRVVRTTKAAVVKTVPVKTAVDPASARVVVSRGSRFTNVASYAVILDGRYVEFDVAPRVDEGVPMTPFRHLIERSGGSVDWANELKTVSAFAEGREIKIRIGNSDATIGADTVRLELAPYLDRGRTIVPLSFLRDALGVEIEFDKATNHVLITSVKRLNK